MILMPKSLKSSTKWWFNTGFSISLSSSSASSPLDVGQYCSDFDIRAEPVIGHDGYSPASCLSAVKKSSADNSIEDK